MKDHHRWLAASLLFWVNQAHTEQHRITLPCPPIPGLQWTAHSAARMFVLCATDGLSGHVVDLRSGEPLLSTRLEEVTSSIIAVSFSDDGNTVALMTVGGTAILYSVGEPPRTLPAGRPGQGISFASGSRLLVMNLRVWDLRAEARPIATLGGDFGAIRDSALVPGGVAAMAGEDTTIRLYDAETWQALREIRSSYTTPRAVAFSLDGRQLFAGGVDRLVRRYDPQSGLELESLKPAGLVSDLLMLPDGKSLAVQTEAMVAVPPATWEIIDIESGGSRPCAQDRTTHGVAVVDGETWCISVEGEIVDAWTLR